MATMQGNGNRNQSGQQGSTGQELSRRQGQGAMERPMRRRRWLSPLSSSLARPLGTFGTMSPFSMVRRMFDDMERMMEGLIPDVEDLIPESTIRELEFVPRIDVNRHDEDLIIRADLPGISPDQVRVYASEDGGLVIEGERRIEDERREGDLWQAERVYGRFCRVVPMPEGTDFESAKARFENGVLEVTLHAPPVRGRGRRIEIQTGGQGQVQQRQPNPPKGERPQAESGRT